MGRFESKVILVTGGSTGIGLAVARRVASEGGAVVIGARRADIGEDAARDIRASGARVVFVPTDVTSEADVTALVQTATNEFGRLDGAFNNAGGVDAVGPLAEMESAAWDADLALNLTSVFYCLKAEIAAMQASGSRGSIVNNASIASTIGVAGMAPYAASKHGVIGLTRSAALEGAAHGLRVNALVTGNVDTPLYRRMLGFPLDGPRADLDAPNPSGRVADPAEIAAFVAFLLSDESAFITGAALSIDGGSGAR
jgi:NAD(P)-dependent dehydrogenase (short-subunit alcohol dehydrogenase family)